MRQLDDLLGLLAAEMDAAEARWRPELRALHGGLAGLGRRNDARWESTSRDVRALYLTSFQPGTEGTVTTKKGDAR